MATHDFILDNQGGTAMRTDVNNALAAIKSTSSAGSEPSSPVEGQLWWDSTNNMLKHYTGSAWEERDISGTAMALAIALG